VNVAVVVPCYNLAHYLVDALESVVHQTRSATDIIVVDDQSTDATREVAADYPVTLLSVSNRGLAAAQNAGAMEAIRRGAEALIFLDADDILYPTYIEKTTALMEDDPQVGVVTTALEADGVTVAGGIWEVSERITLGDLWRQTCVWAASLVRATAFTACGGFAPNMDPTTDWDLWIDIAKRGWHIRGINEPLWYWRDRPDAMHTTLDVSATRAMLLRHHVDALRGVL
jgi:glycosyltransferase involved in cell wall biosynthesis